LISSAWAAGIVLLDQGDTTEEDRFASELTLSVDGVQVRPGPEGFSQAPLSVQLDAVRPILAEADMAAVAWLDTTDAVVLRVSVAFVEADRAIVRLLDMERGAGAEAHLALATRELISSAYQDDQPMTVPDPPPDPPVVAEPVVEPPAWWATVSGGVVWPPASHSGGVRGNISLALSRLQDGQGAGILLGVQRGVEQTRMGVGPRYQWDPFQVGVRADWTKTTWTRQVQPRIWAGVAVPLGPLHGSAQVEFSPIRDEVKLGETIIYDTGWVELSINLSGSRKIGQR